MVEGANNEDGARYTQISFVVLAIVPTSVGIRGTEVQFLAMGTPPSSWPASIARVKWKKKNDS